MGYKGQTYQIPCNRGGLVDSPNIDALAVVQMIPDTENISLDEDGRKKRGGTSVIETGYGSAQIMGGFDFTMEDGTQFNMVATTDGKVWKNSTTSIHTFVAIGEYVSFVVLNDVLYICNGANIPQVWDGSAGSTSDMADTPSDWTGSNFPSHMVVHGVGESERLWAIGAKPDIVYASALNDGTEADFGDVNVVTIRINTSDGFGIVAGIEFGDKLVVFSKRRAYIIVDTDTDDGNWGYRAAQWSGGVAHYRLLVRTPNDLFAMMEDGEIYSVTTAEQFGDYKEASVSRPAFIDRYLRNNIKFDDVAKFHATYDSELAHIKWFVVRSGQTQVDTALLFYLDRAIRHSPEEAWTIHGNTSNDSGYSASASWNYRLEPPEDHRDYIYTGDYSGQVWDLEEIATNDNNTAYTGKFKTPNMHFDNPRITKNYRRGWVVVKPEGTHNLSVNTWIDGAVFGSTQQVSLAGLGAVYGTAVYGTDVYGGDEVLNRSFDIGGKGNRIQFELFNTGVDESFFVSQILIDYKPTGNRPQ